MRYLLKAVEGAARWALGTPGTDGYPMIGDKVFLTGLGRMLAQIEAATCTPQATGRVKGAEVAIWGCEQLLDLVGPDAVLPYGADGAIAGGAIEYAHRAVQVGATGGGSVEVFRAMIAQHQLGLPQPEYPGRRVFLQQRRPTAAA
jgi:hypothetical protein